MSDDQDASVLPDPNQLDVFAQLRDFAERGRRAQQEVNRILDEDKLRRAMEARGATAEQRADVDRRLRALRDQRRRRGRGDPD